MLVRNQRLFNKKIPIGMPMKGADSYRLRRNDAAMKNYGWYNKKASRNTNLVVKKK